MPSGNDNLPRDQQPPVQVPIVQAPAQLNPINHYNQQYQPRLVRFTLPDFTPNDPEIWFSAVDHIFRTNSITSEEEKFSSLLQYIDSTELGHIRDIIPSNSPTKYSQAKARLQQIHGRSRLEQINKLLQGVDTNTQTKPSVILNKMRSLVGPECTSDEIIRSIWLQKLPARTKEILAVNNELSLDKQAEMADRLFETYEIQNYSTQNVAAVSHNNDITQNSVEMLINMIHNLQTQISAINNRGRSPTRTSFRTRSRSRQYRSPSANRTPQMFNGLCWYHHTFGTNARKCTPGCNSYSENTMGGL